MAYDRRQALIDIYGDENKASAALDGMTQGLTDPMQIEIKADELIAQKHASPRTRLAAAYWGDEATAAQKFDAYTRSKKVDEKNKDAMRSAASELIDMQLKGGARPGTPTDSPDMAGPGATAYEQEHPIAAGFIGAGKGLGAATPFIGDGIVAPTELASAPGAGATAANILSGLTRTGGQIVAGGALAPFTGGASMPAAGAYTGAEEIARRERIRQMQSGEEINYGKMWDKINTPAGWTEVGINAVLPVAQAKVGAVLAGGIADGVAPGATGAIARKIFGRSLTQDLAAGTSPLAAVPKFLAKSAAVDYPMNVVQTASSQATDGQDPFSMEAIQENLKQSLAMLPIGSLMNLHGAGILPLNAPGRKPSETALAQRAAIARAMEAGAAQRAQAIPRAGAPEVLPVKPEAADGRVLETRNGKQQFVDPDSLGTDFDPMQEWNPENPNVSKKVGIQRAERARADEQAEAERQALLDRVYNGEVDYGDTPSPTRPRLFDAQGRMKETPKERALVRHPVQDREGPSINARPTNYVVDEQGNARIVDRPEAPPQQLEGEPRKQLGYDPAVKIKLEDFAQSEADNGRPKPPVPSDTEIRMGLQQLEQVHGLKNKLSPDGPQLLTKAEVQEALEPVLDRPVSRGEAGMWRDLYHDMYSDTVLKRNEQRAGNWQPIERHPEPGASEQTPEPVAAAPAQQPVSSKPTDNSFLLNGNSPTGGGAVRSPEQIGEQQTLFQAKPEDGEPLPEKPPTREEYNKRRDVDASEFGLGRLDPKQAIEAAGEASRTEGKVQYVIGSRKGYEVTPEQPKAPGDQYYKVYHDGNEVRSEVVRNPGEPVAPTTKYPAKGQRPTEQEWFDEYGPSQIKNAPNVPRQNARIDLTPGARVITDIERQSISRAFKGTAQVEHDENGARITLKNGKTVRIQTVHQIGSGVDPVSYAQGLRAMGRDPRTTKATIKGMVAPEGMRVTISDNGGKPQIIEADHIMLLSGKADETTIPHEVFHLAKRLVLDAKQQRALDGYYRGGEEQQADAYSQYIRERGKAHPGIRFIHDTFDRLANAIAPSGASKARQVFRQVEKDGFSWSAQERGAATKDTRFQISIDKDELRHSLYGTNEEQKTFWDALRESTDINRKVYPWLHEVAATGRRDVTEANKYLSLSTKDRRKMAKLVNDANKAGNNLSIIDAKGLVKKGSVEKVEKIIMSFEEVVDGNLANLVLGQSIGKQKPGTIITNARERLKGTPAYDRIFDTKGNIKSSARKYVEDVYNKGMAAKPLWQELKQYGPEVRRNIHQINRFLAAPENKEYFDQVHAISDRLNKAGIANDPFDENGLFKPLPTETVLKKDPITGEMLIKNAGWARSIPQLILDSIAPDAFERLRKPYYDATRAAYEAVKSGSVDPAKKGLYETILGKGFKGKTWSALGSEDEGRKVGGESVAPVDIAPAVREAHKTLAAASFNSACPMLTIGNNGCYLNACYLTQMASGGTTTNLYKRGMYTGELLQVSQAEIDSINRAGGLRINGVGDTTGEVYAQWKDLIRDAGERGINLKIITKQEQTFKNLRQLREEGQDLGHIIVQPSMDNLWIPASMDDVEGGGIRDTGEAYLNRPDTDPNSYRPLVAAEGYKMNYGRDAKMLDIDGKQVLYRKYGFTPEHVNALRKEFPEVTVTPRWVVNTAEELAYTALTSEDTIQTLMHGKVPDEAIIELPNGKIERSDRLINFGDYRHEFVQNEDRTWDFWAVETNKKGNRALDKRSKTNGVLAVEAAISKYTPEEQERIWNNLKRQVCCQNNMSLDACGQCKAVCAMMQALDPGKNVQVPFKAKKVHVVKNPVPEEFQSEQAFQEMVDAGSDERSHLQFQIEDEAPVPGEEGLPKYAGSVNLMTANTSDDVLDMFVNEAQRNEAELNRVRQKGRTWDDIKGDAGKRFFSDAQLERMSKRIGRPLRDSDLLALDQHMLALAQDAKTAQEAFAAQDSAENLAKVLEATKRFQAAFLATSGARSATGRALNQYKMIRSARQSMNTSNKMVVQQRLLEALGGSEMTQKMIEDLAHIPEGDVIGLRKWALKYKPNTLGNAIHTYWSANVLSGIPTQGRNFVSNTIWSAALMATRPASGLVDRATSMVSGKPRSVHVRETLPAAVGYLAGLPRGMRRAFEVLAHGTTEADAARLDLEHGQELPGGGFNPINWPFRMLGAADQMARSMAENSELYAQATRKALNEKGASGSLRERVNKYIESPDEEMMAAVDRFGKQATFTDDPDELLRRLMHLRGLTHPALHGVKPLAFIVPWLKVPYNITKASLEYTPAGVAGVALKGGTKAEVSEAIGKAAVGSLALIPLAALAAQGKITGAIPQSGKKREEYFRLKKEPYSIQIGKKWYSWKLFGPLALHFATVAALHDVYTDEDVKPDESKIGKVAGAILKQQVDTSFLTTMNDLIAAIDEGGKGVRSEKIMSSLLQGGIPLSALQRNIAQSMDPKIRDAQGVYERIKAGLPVLSKDIPAKLNAWGEDSERSGGTGWKAFSPTRISEESNDPVDMELARLDIQPIGTNMKEVRIRNEKIPLSREEQRDLAVAVGQTQRKMVEKFMDSSRFERMDDEQKALVLKKVMSRAHEVAVRQYRAKVARAQRQ